MKSERKEIWEFPILIPKNPIKKEIKNLAGRIVQLFFPEIRQNLLGGKNPTNKVERIVLCSLFIELKANNQYEKLADLHKHVWASNETQGYYDLTSNRLKGMFGLVKNTLYESITNFIQEHSYEALIELGCGEGFVVDKLSEKFTDIPSFIGMDINESQIKKNKINYSTNKRLRFFSGDISKNINLIKGSNRIFLSFGGVLEYLTEKEITNLFESLSSQENIAIIIYEPIKPGFNIKKEKHSILYGSEFSFCHPYHYYLEKYGFKIINSKLVESDEINWMYVASQAT